MPKIFKKKDKGGKKWYELFSSVTRNFYFWSYDFDVIVSGRYRPAGGDEEFDNRTFKCRTGVPFGTEPVYMSRWPVNFTKPFCIPVEVFEEIGGTHKILADLEAPLSEALEKKTDTLHLRTRKNERGSVDLTLKGSKGFLALKVRATSIELLEHETINVFLSFQNSRGGAITRSNCNMGVKTGKSCDVSWRPMTIHTCQSLLKKKVHLKIGHFMPEAWKKGSESLTTLANCKLSFDSLLKEPGEVHTMKETAVNQKDRILVEFTYLYDEGFPSILEYRFGGLSLSMDIQADKKALGCSIVVNAVTETFSKLVNPWRDRRQEVDRFKAKGKTFKDLLEDTMNRAKKIEPGKGYMLFVYIAGSSKVAMEAEQLLQSSLLPISVIIVRSCKETSKEEKELYLPMDIIRETIDAEETDYFGKKNKRRCNLLIDSYDRNSFKKFNEGTIDTAPFRYLIQQMMEYLYLNDIKPCSPTH